jgi:hypothetical protein
MQWDLGFEGLALLGAMSLGFGLVAGLAAGKDLAHRLWTAVVTTVACLGAGLVTSEVLFGWATEEELQPNIDGLSRDEVLLSSALITVLVVVAMRYVARWTQEPRSRGGRHRTSPDMVGRHQEGRRHWPIGHA